MVKLSAELISQAHQHTNPVKDRELDLRGYKIPVIENMGATLDQFDTIDLSDNDIRKLDGFPLLKRLKTLMLNNNRIVRISEGLENCIPNLDSLILTGNLIQELSDLDPLASLSHLRTLSLLHCPVVTKPHYRLYIAFKLPQVKLLDFRKIKMKEREEASTLFRSKKGRELQREIAGRAKTFIPGGGPGKVEKKRGPSKEDVLKIRQAIQNAISLDEIERLSRLLQRGETLEDGPAKKDKNGLQQEAEEMDTVD